MAALQLFGTTTSPFVRRVRIVAAECGLACELVDTASEAGQISLRAVTPIWKVPVARIGERTVFDSHAITELLLAEHPSPLRPFDPLRDLDERNIITVIDGALDAAINAFYFRRDGYEPETMPYTRKQLERTDAALAWLDARIDGDWLTATPRLGLAEIALVTALGWMQFRGAVDIERFARLRRAFERHDARASFAATRPHA